MSEHHGACSRGGPVQVNAGRADDRGDSACFTGRGVVRTVRQGLTFSCNEGYCGTCETAVISGFPLTETPFSARTSERPGKP